MKPSFSGSAGFERREFFSTLSFSIFDPPFVSNETVNFTGAGEPPPPPEEDFFFHCAVTVTSEPIMVNVVSALLLSARVMLSAVFQPEKV